MTPGTMKPKPKVFVLFVIVTFALQMITLQFEWEQRYGTDSGQI